MVRPAATEPQQSTAPIVVEEAPEPVDYSPLISQDQGTRQITGTSFSAHSTAPFLRTNAVTGTIEQEGRAFTFSDNVFAFSDADGPNAQNEFSDGTLEMLTDPATYKFVTRYSIVDRTRASVGVFGIGTQSADMPQAGTATFHGFGEITEVYPPRVPGTQSTVVDHVASSKLDVNFATGKVNAELKVQALAVQIGSEVDRISARGMQLNGATFSGTTVKMFNNSTRVFPTGTNPDNEATGQFFGAKRDSSGQLTPAEAGGVILSSSRDGFIFGSFVAK